MNRLQKKCIIASSGLHGLLVLILFVGPAFFSKQQPPEEYHVITVIDGAKITDGPTRGGGNPNVTEMPKAAPAPAPTPPAQPPKPEPQEEKPEPAPQKVEVKDPPKAVEEPAPVKRPQPREVVRKEDPDGEPTPKKSVKTQPKFDFTEVVRGGKTSKNSTGKTGSSNSKIELKPTTRTANSSSRSASSSSSSSSRSDKQNQIWNKIASGLGSAKNNVLSGTGSSTSVEMPGPGGEAFVNYGDLIGNVYQSRYDRALLAAGDIADKNASVDVSVTIARTGRVVSGRITRRSGNVALDKLVQRILDQVDFVAPFPDGTRDAQRSFNITFDLKTRRLTG
jgi:TonB family protein